MKEEELRWIKCKFASAPVGLHDQGPTKGFGRPFLLTIGLNIYWDLLRNQGEVDGNVSWSILNHLGSSWSILNHSHMWNSMELLILQRFSMFSGLAVAGRFGREFSSSWIVAASPGGTRDFSFLVNWCLDYLDWFLMVHFFRETTQLL